MEISSDILNQAQIQKWNAGGNQWKNEEMLAAGKKSLLRDPG